MPNGIGINFLIKKLGYVASFVSIFLFSYCVGGYYVNGDQESYTLFYDNVINYELIEGYAYYRSFLGAAEPVYYFLVWSFSRILEKNLFFSLLNSLVGVLLLRWMLLKRVSFVVIGLMAINFYLMVIFFSAERLKVGFLFIMLLPWFGQMWRNLLVLLSVFSHLQLFLLLVARQFYLLLDGVLRLLKGRMKKHILTIFAASFLLLIALGPIFPYLLSKLSIYYDASHSFLGFFKAVFFLLLTTVYMHGRKAKFEVICMHLPIVVSTLIVGGERLIILSFVIFMYYALQIRRGLNLGVVFLSLYYAIKGLAFLQSVFMYGDGFHTA